LSRSSITILGDLAARARRVGAGSVLRRAVRVVDRVYAALGRAPLTVEVAGAEIHGYLRHRSFLAETTRPARTYVDLFLRTVRPGMTIVDGGAHVGLYTVLGARAVGPDGLVLAFEPDRYNLAALRLNVHGATNVRIVEKALTDAPGTATFHETPSTIGSSLLERADSSTRVVETTSVDAELGERRAPSLLVKLNVEGAEPLVIAGMRETLDRVRSISMLVEVNPALVSAAGTDVDALVRTLEGEGFAVGFVDLETQDVVHLPAPIPKGHIFASRG